MFKKWSGKMKREDCICVRLKGGFGVLLAGQGVYVCIFLAHLAHLQRDQMFKKIIVRYLRHTRESKL